MTPQLLLDIAHLAALVAAGIVGGYLFLVALLALVTWHRLMWRWWRYATKRRE